MPTAVANSRSSRRSLLECPSVWPMPSKPTLKMLRKRCKLTLFPSLFLSMTHRFCRHSSEDSRLTRKLDDGKDYWLMRKTQRLAVKWYAIFLYPKRLDLTIPLGRIPPDALSTKRFGQSPLTSGQWACLCKQRLAMFTCALCIRVNIALLHVYFCMCLHVFSHVYMCR
jgi:hypothetical protein